MTLFTLAINMLVKAVEPEGRKEGRKRQTLVQEEVQASVEGEQISRAVAKQGAWTRWEQVMEQSVTWKEIWQWDPQRIKFLIKGVHNVLPSPSNLFTWGKAERPACLLRIGTDGGTTRSSNPLLKKSARGSRGANTPKPEPRPTTLSRKGKGQRSYQRTALPVCSPQPETGCDS